MAATLTSERLNAIPVERFEQATRWMEKSRQVPPPVALVLRASLWLARVDSFRAAEDEALATGEHSATLQEHKFALANLITGGEQIVRTAGKLGWPAWFAEFSLEDVSATLNSLRTTLRCQHGGKNSRAVRARIEAMLGEP